MATSAVVMLLNFFLLFLLPVRVAIPKLPLQLRFPVLLPVPYLAMAIFFFGGRTRDVVTTTVLPAWVE